MDRNLVCAAALLAAAAAPPLRAAQEVRVPFEDSVWYACGPEEAVALSGTYHRRVWERVDGAGVRHRHIAYNLQGVEGIGSLTGERYVAVQGEHSAQQFSWDGTATRIEVHSVLVVRLVRTGPGDDALLHFAIDAVYLSTSEDPVEERVRFWSDCRG